MDSMSMAMSTGMSMSMFMPTTTTSMAMGSMTSSVSAAMSTSTGMNMGSSMSMGSSSCKVSMLWNWYTIDACFLSKSWHITSNSMFGGSCIGVICLVLILEFLRRVSREYDSYIIRRTTIQRQHRAASAAGTASQPSPSSSNANANANGTGTDAAKPSDPTSISLPSTARTGPIRPTLFEQLVRAALHMLQFAVAYFVMLLAMYYNGYIIICIFIGAFLGAFIFSWEPLAGGEERIEATGCCG